MLIQPQYNVSRYELHRNDIKDMTGYEVGLSAGLLARKNFFIDFLSAYLCISIGPHYISDSPIRQSNGFIFSDNLFAGIDLRISKKYLSGSKNWFSTS